MGDTLSEWVSISKTNGAPRSSIMGPFAYNIFTNDLLLQLEKHRNGCVFNYADGNTVSASDATTTGVNSKLNCRVYLLSNLRETSYRQMLLSSST